MSSPWPNLCLLHVNIVPRPPWSLLAIADSSGQMGELHRSGARSRVLRRDRPGPKEVTVFTERSNMTQ